MIEFITQKRIPIICAGIVLLAAKSIDTIFLANEHSLYLVNL